MNDCLLLNGLWSIHECTIYFSYVIKYCNMSSLPTVLGFCHKRCCKHLKYKQAPMKSKYVLHVFTLPIVTVCKEAMNS